MELKIRLPNDVGEYLLLNPEATRQEIKDTFNISDRKAHTYRSILNFMKKIEESEEIKDRLKEAHVDFTKSLGETKASVDATVTCPHEMLDEEGAVTEVLKQSGMDNPHWIISDVTVKRWNTGMKLKNDGVEEPHIVTQWSVKIKFRPNVNKNVYSAFRDWTKEKAIFADPLPRLQYNVGGFADPNIMGMLMLADVHWGKQAWANETGLGSMDLPIVSEIFDKTVDVLVEKFARDNPSFIMFPVGHDLLHYENRQGKTTDGGNILDTDSRLPKVIKACLQSTYRAIDMCAQIAPTRVVWVPGNHDYLGSLAIILGCLGRYENNPHVEVDDSPEILKAYLWGETLLGHTHDMSGAKMVRGVELFKSTFRHLYGQCTWNEIFTGHLHKASTKTFGNMETIGETVVRICSSLSTTDMWHLMNFFTDAVPAGESFSIHKEEGVTTAYKKNIDYRKYR